MVFPSPGEANAVVTLPAVMSPALNTRSVVVVPSLTRIVSPATAPAGIVTLTSTFPLSSLLLRMPLLFASSLMLTVGVLLSVITIPLSVPSLPAGSVATTEISVIPSAGNCATVLSGSVHVPSPLLVASYSTPPIITVIVAVGSSTVPVSSGVRSLVVRLFIVTFGAVVSELVELVVVVAAASL